MKNIITLTILFCTYSTIFGQVLQSVQSVDTHSYYQILSPSSGKMISYDQINGSPYYNKEFMDAKVGSNYESLNARYNAYSDEIEFQKDNQIFVLPKQDTFSEIIFSNLNQKFVLLNTEDELSGYFLELNSGKYKIYKKIKSKFTDFIKSSSGYSEDKPAKFQTLDPTFYIKTENGFIKNPKNVKIITSAFTDKKEAIEGFVKSNKIKFNNEADLIKLVNFLNQ